MGITKERAIQIIQKDSMNIEATIITKGTSKGVVFFVADSEDLLVRLKEMAPEADFEMQLDDPYEFIMEVDKEQEEHLRKYGGYIPDIHPGQKVYLSRDGDLLMNSNTKSFVINETPLTYVKRTKGGMDVVADDKGKEYKVPPRNVKRL